MYANIIVDISYDKIDRPFTYRVPDSLRDSVDIGTLVNVPFGNGGRQIKGYVTELKENAAIDIPEDKIKDIAGVVETNLTYSSDRIKLAAFIRNNYGGSMSQALKTVIPVKKSVKQSVRKSVECLIENEQLDTLLKEFYGKKNAAARIRLLEALKNEKIIDYSLLTTKLALAPATIKAFENKGYIKIKEAAEYRNPVDVANKEETRHVLNDKQQYIVNCINKDYDNNINETYLIHGITGSGKTEVYLDIIEHVVESGKQVIFLIPEISLTFQTVMRFYKRFGDRVTIINSRLSAGERYDQFMRASKGEVDIVIGPRSALFTPFERLGLVVIDEEHESAYKSESVPKYHAIGVAKELCRLKKASLILGSATPSMESYYKAMSGEYTLFTLNQRAVSNSVLPTTHLVDLREELKEGNRSIFSRKLVTMINERLQKGEQTMLFINRRGYFGFISCRSCGNVIKCPHCDVSLTLHNNNTLVCHYCGYKQPQVKSCPKCNSNYIGALNGGTQMVEESIAKLFPSARVLRMDADTTTKKESYDNILSAFMNEEADILIGTQMIVKGHDFPKVTLVGILAADISLHASDYRAAERTFNLLTQAAGRAGRGSIRGDVVIQGYDMDNFAIKAAAGQEYNEYYNQEIMYRSLMDYPPVTNMMVVRLSSKYENKLEAASKLMQINREGLKVFGPANAPLYKAMDVYNKLIYIKSPQYEELVKLKTQIEEYVKKRDEFKYVSVLFDFNPAFIN